MNINNWIEKNCTSLEGKTICITGSTGGLAVKFTEQLASLGANFIFANRNKEKSETQKQKLLLKYPSIKIKILTADMFDINSVKLLVCKLMQEKFDILIINSAVYNVPRKTSSAGFDNVFQINFVSPYFLIKKLIPNMRKDRDSKVIIIGSIAHNYSKVDFDDIQKLKTKKQSVIYGNSKRFLMFATQKLLSDNNINLAIVHPGVTLTNMTNHYPAIINPLVKLGIKTIFPTPQKACLSILYGIFHNTSKNEWIGPAKHNVWGYPKLQKLSTCSESEQVKIFETAENIYNSLNK